MIKSRAAGVSARAVRAGMGGAGDGRLQGDVTEVWTGDKSWQGCLESHRELLLGFEGPLQGRDPPGHVALKTIAYSQRSARRKEKRQQSQS